MAKRSHGSNSSGGGNYSTVKVLAFIALALTAIAGIASFIISLLAAIGVTISWANQAVSICSLISQISLLLCVGIAGWDYVRGKTKGYRILYAVALVLCILGLVGVGISVSL